MTKPITDAETLARALRGKPQGRGWRCLCPAHDDQDPSLDIEDGDKGVVFICRTGCTQEAVIDVLAARGLWPAEPPKKTNNRANSGTKAWTLVSEHIYRAEAGQPYLRVRKMLDPHGNRQYPQSHWNGSGWVRGAPKGSKIPYRLPQLIGAPLDATIYISEGEKDADALDEHGLIATTASGGASAKWDDALTPHFKDRHVVVLPDADRPGRAHGQKVARALNGVAASVKVIDLFPDRRDGSDVSNWLETDPTGDRLVRECSQAPLWQPDGHDDDKPDGGVDTPAAPPPHLKKQADILIQLAGEADLFHTPGGEAYADVTVGDHRETYRIRSRTFRSWLSHQFYKTQAGAPNSEAMTSALGTIEAHALFDGPKMDVHVRVAELEGKLYLDLADEKWRAVEIDCAGWRIVTSPPVRFRRAPGTLPLREPTAGGSIDALRPLLNVRDDNDFVLAVSWLLAAYRPRGPYPILALAGEQGSSKSMLSALLRGLIDPNVAPLRALPREERDLFISACNAHALVFDNVSGLPTWINDALCRLATGGGFATRQLYTDDAEALFDAMRPIVLNGIEDVAVRPDLVDRAIVLSLDTIPEPKRRPEDELWAAFHRDMPGILGALLDAVGHGLARLDQVRLERLPRMADFYKWATSCETAFWPEGTFAAAYSANREGAIAVTIDADLVATAVSAFMSNRETWSGTASELLDTLSLLVTETQRRSKEWPSVPHFLSGRLRRAAPVLRKTGIEITFARDGKRTIHINRLPESEPEPASAASAASDDSRSSGLASDAPADAGDCASVSPNSLNTPVPDALDAPDAASPSPTACEYCREPPDDTIEECSFAGHPMKVHRRCLPMLRMFERYDKGK